MGNGLAGVFELEPSGTGRVPPVLDDIVLWVEGLGNSGLRRREGDEQ